MGHHVVEDMDVLATVNMQPVHSLFCSIIVNNQTLETLL